MIQWRKAAGRLQLARLAGPAVLFLGLPFLAHASPGDLDNNFGSGGVVMTKIGSSHDQAYAIALQPDGKMVVGGFAFNGVNNDFAAARYNTDGGLDSNFGNGGRVITPIGPGDDQIDAIAIQADGKIVAAGYSFNGANNDFALIRYNPDGSLDSTFDAGGKVITPFGANPSEIHAVAIQSDGKIVAAGLAFDGGNSNFALARYNLDGSLDLTFGVGGKVTTDFGASVDTANAVAVQPDGKIVVAGAAALSFALARYNPDGSLDPSFGNSGRVITVIGAANDQANAVAIQSDGKIVAAGFTADTQNDLSNAQFAVVRYNPDGSLDPTFNVDGKAVTSIGPGNDRARALAIQTNGKIVVGGYSIKTNATYGNFALVRYNPDGTLDTGFNTDGMVTTAIVSKNDLAYGLALQSDGKIVLAGYAFNGSDNDFALTRYFGDATSISGVDLAVTLIGGPSNAAPGDVVTLDNTVLNQGKNSSGGFNVGFYLSTDALIMTPDLFLGGRYVSGLSPASSNTGTLSVTLPTRLGAGTYYIGAIADYDNRISESNEGNNARAGNLITIGAPSAATPSPDLTMTAINGPPGATPGSAMTLSDTVFNQGSGSAGAFTVGYYLSTDTVITTADLFLGGRSISGLAPGTGSSGSATVTAPSSVPSGTYFIGAIADYDKKIPEGNETNNALAGNAISISGTAPSGGAGIDLVIGSVSGPATAAPGGSMTLSDMVLNQGTTLSGGFNVGYYLSTDVIITATDMFLGSRYVASLSGGGNNSGSILSSLPPSIGAGTYYLGAIADYTGLIAEINEGNNAKAGNAIAVTTGADLVMNGISGPTSASAGSGVTLSDTVFNSGTGSAGGFNVGYYLSTDTVITTGDIFLGSRFVNGLAAGTINSGSIVATIPSNIPSGTYYLGAVADYDGKVPENSETNNSQVGNSIAVAGTAVGADLVMTLVSGPSSATPGSAMTITNTVLNQGTGSAGSFNVGLYLSTDSLITTSDILLGTWSSFGLGGGVSATQNTSVILPANIVGGTYYLGAIADVYNAVAETNESNNSFAGNAITVQTPNIPTAVTDIASVIATTGATLNGNLNPNGQSSTGWFEWGVTTAYGNATAAQALGSGTAPVNFSQAVAGLSGNTTYHFRAVGQNGFGIAYGADRTFTTLASGPDLVPTVFTVTPSGNQVYMDDRVVNFGDAEAASFTIRFYLSVDNIFQRGTDIAFNCSRTVSALYANQSSPNMNTTRTTCPTPSVAPGSYAVFVFDDADNTVLESNENNNVLAAAYPLNIGPDLAPTSITVSKSGTKFTITDTVVNRGTSDASSFKIGYYLSTDTTYQAGTDLFICNRSVGSLSAGSSNSLTFGCNVPSASPGMYYIIAYADSGNAVAESVENNNTLSTTNTITIP